MRARISGLKTSFRPRTLARVSRVRSSSVGPRPPMHRMSRERPRAVRRTRARSLSSSPTTVLNETASPIAFRPAVRKREFVSWKSGVRSSEPTAMISVFMILPGPQTKSRTRRVRAAAAKPAPTSSAMIPQPPGSFSSFRIGQGLMISKKRKRAKEIPAWSQPAGRKARATSWPQTSSMTMRPGSGRPSAAAWTAETAAPAKKRSDEEDA